MEILQMKETVCWIQLKKTFHTFNKSYMSYASLYLIAWKPTIELIQRMHGLHIDVPYWISLFHFFWKVTAVW